MSDPDPKGLLQPAATQVRDPVSGQSTWDAGMVRNPRLKGADLVYDLHFSVDHSVAVRQAIERTLKANLRKLGFEGKVYAMPSGAAPRMKPQAPASVENPMPTGPVRGVGGPRPLAGVAHVVAVASGKGGVGKSTVATNLAVALARLGHTVGLLDANIQGPSVHTMMGCVERPENDPNTRRILPAEAHGVRCLSMGQLMDQDEAMIWRGAMVMSAIKQFLHDATWRGTDYLIVDLPPGSGDALLTLIQAVDLSGAIVVTTPQPVALADAVRGISMFRQLEVPVLGVVENMAWYECPHGDKVPVFGEHGGRDVAAGNDTELLVRIPLDAMLRQSCDEGVPAALSEGPAAQRFHDLARRVAELVPATKGI